MRVSHLWVRVALPVVDYRASIRLGAATESGFGDLRWRLGCEGVVPKSDASDHSLADVAERYGLPGAAVESRTGRGLSGSHQLGIRPGQSVQSAAHDSDAFRIVQVGRQGDLRRLVPNVTARMHTTQPNP